MARAAATRSTSWSPAAITAGRARRFGIDYDGKLITDRQHVDGLTDPRFVWAPSIAPSGLAVYRGTAHPDWDGKLLVGALAARAPGPGAGRQAKPACWPRKAAGCSASRRASAMSASRRTARSIC